MIGIVNLFVISILLIALGITTTLALRYWNEVTELGNVTITLGTDEDVNMDVILVSPKFEGALVPYSRAYFEGEVEEVTFEYTVSVDKKLIQTMNLIVEAFDITVGGSKKYAHLVEVSIKEKNGEPQVGKGAIDFYNEIVTVIIVVRLLEPIDQAEAALTGKVANVENGELAYQEIKGKQINVKLRFKIEPKN